MTDPEPLHPPLLDGQGGLARASALVLSASLIVLVVGLVRSKIVAVLLGPVGIGALANLNLLLFSASVLASGVAGTGAVRGLVAARARGDARAAAWLERYLFAAPAIVGILLTVVCFLISGPLAAVLLGDPGLWYLVFIVGAAFPVAVLAASYTAWLETLLRIGVIARSDVLTAIVSVPLTAGCLLAWGLAGGAVAVGASVAARLLFLHLGGRTGLPSGDWQLAFRPPAGQAGQVVRLGATAALVSIVTVVGALVIRAVIVDRLDLHAAGLYQPAALFSDTYLDALLASISVYLFPRLTGLLAGGQREAARAELLGGLRIALAITVPLTLVSIGFSSALLTALFTADFQPAAGPLVIQMVGTLPRVIAWSLGLALVPLGRARVWALLALLAVALRLLGVFLLVPSLGLDGAAIAYGVAWSVVAVLTIVAVTRPGGFRFQRSDARLSLAAGGVVGVALCLGTAGGVLAPAGSLGALAIWLWLTRDALRQLVTSLRTR